MNEKFEIRPDLKNIFFAREIKNVVKKDEHP